MMPLLDRKVGCKKGQALIELVFILPLMILLAYGAIEVGSVISTYLTITHTTREGTNLISRGTEVNLALAAIETAAAPTIRVSNNTQWSIIYSKIIQNPAIVPPCTEEPCEYIG
jgi:Flp pilus assembly protein TadG